MELAPGRFQDLSSEEGKAHYLDQGYHSDALGGLLLEAGLLPQPVRRGRYLPFRQTYSFLSKQVRS